MNQVSMSLIEILRDILPGLFVILGVLLGAWITTRNLKTERKQAHYRRQLADFYSPMHAWHTLIKTRSITRLTLFQKADEIWRQMVAQRRNDVDELRRLSEGKGQDFQKIIEEDNRIFLEEIFPLYKKILDHFTENYWLAEPSTQKHYPALVEYIDLWDRWLRGSIPPEVMRATNNNESKLHPLYQDLEDQIKQLQSQLVK